MDTGSADLHSPTSSSAADSQPATTAKQIQTWNTEQIAELRDGNDAKHIAEHIRGMVALTMGTLSVRALDATLNDAQKWQQWALGVADGLELHVTG
ncbi:MAG: hypothetical protein WAW34_07100 [Rhodoferax sp.]